VARDASRTTSEHTAQINAAAGEVNAASNRISELSVQNNDHISQLYSRLDEHQAGDHHLGEHQDGEAKVGAEARERLELSNIILNHMSWVSRARAAIDRDEADLPADLVDHERCTLGRWLAARGEEVIADRSAYAKLADTHKRLHERLERIFSCEECGDVEEEFQHLLEDSHSIVEILTGYQTGSFVQWSPAIAVNVSAFDGHHQKLLQIIDRLYKAMQAGAAKAELSKIFDELLNYTGYHFGAENAAFEHFQYPECEHHQREHKELVAKAVALRKDFEQDKPMAAVEVMEFLRDWVTNHIRNCDKRYSGFFADKNVNAFLESRS
jgi:hemerythrin-like metal-binding protein